MLKSEKRNWDRCRQNRQTLCLTDCLQRRAAMPFGLDGGLRTGGPISAKI